MNNSILNLTANEINNISGGVSLAEVYQTAAPYIPLVAVLALQAYIVTMCYLARKTK